MNVNHALRAHLVFLPLYLSLALWEHAQRKPPAEPVDLNSATLGQLAQLPGIGPSTAKAIFQFREKSGPFERVEDLLAIHGISKKRLQKTLAVHFRRLSGPEI